jgi:hypothetical protein
MYNFFKKKKINQPSVTYSVDNPIQTHDWTDTVDVISSYKEVCKQPDIYQEKLREGQMNLKKISSHYEQLPQKAAQIFSNVTTIGNISKEFKQEEESALRTEEKHLIRILGLSVSCGSKFVSPKILKW